MLLVDDEADILYTLQSGLSTCGFLVDAFSDPANVMTNYKVGYYDAIILDIRMPYMTGFELARALWEKEPKAQICFLTAFEIFEIEAKAMFPTLNSHCFVKKPITPNKLAEHIKSHFVEAN